MCFYVNTGTTATWADAQTACQAKSANLATITSSTDDDAVQALCSADTWIGLNDKTTDDSYTWIEDNSALIRGTSYENWFGTSNPLAGSNGSDCIKKQYAKTGQWNDVGCSKTMNYACSMPAVSSCATTTTAFVTTTVSAGSAAR
jgi:hypothetical protein